jgi:hypothetical protein
MVVFWIKLQIKVQECDQQTIQNKMLKKLEVVCNFLKVEWVGSVKREAWVILNLQIEVTLEIPWTMEVREVCLLIKVRVRSEETEWEEALDHPVYLNQIAKITMPWTIRT